MVPCVGATTVSEGTVTRIPSNSSSESSGLVVPEGAVVSAAVMVCGVGSGLPVERTLVETVPEISVIGGLFGSELKTNSCTVPLTCTLLPTTAAAGTLEPVKTKTPLDVLGSASQASSCMKKPPDEPALMPVTMPRVLIDWPTTGEVVPE